jgi:hypothetical protein
VSISFHPSDGLAVYVEDPGYGYLAVELRGRVGDRDDEGWRILEGPAIGAALRAVTALALDDVEEWRVVDVPGIGRLSRAEARILLRPLAEAAVYAAAGGERAERILDEPEPHVAGDPPDYPREPLCATCNEGSPYRTGPAAAALAWCGEHGHTVYGVDSDRRLTWAAAQARHARDLEAYERRRQYEAELAADVVDLDSHRT